MAVFQAAEAFSLFTDRTAAPREMLRHFATMDFLVTLIVEHMMSVWWCAVPAYVGWRQ